MIEEDYPHEGLVLGVTTVNPGKNLSLSDKGGFPRVVADKELDPSWCVGFDGRWWSGSILQWAECDFDPTTLQPMDRVGIFIAVGNTLPSLFDDEESRAKKPPRRNTFVAGQMYVFVNKRLVAVGPQNIPFEQGLFPVVDLLGNCTRLTLVRDPTQPPQWDPFQSVGISNVRDDLLIYDDHIEKQALEHAQVQRARDRVAARLKAGFTTLDSSCEMVAFMPSVAKNVKVVPELAAADADVGHTVVYVGPVRYPGSEFADDFRNCHAIGDGIIPYCHFLNGWFFEVRVDAMVDPRNLLHQSINDTSGRGGFFDDGLTIGVTRETPTRYVHRARAPPTVDQLDSFWGFGFDGSSFGYGKWESVCDVFHPGIDLQVGDRVGLLIRKNSSVSLFHNGLCLLTNLGWNDLNPAKHAYYPVIDLLGGVLEVTWLPVLSFFKAGKVFSNI